MAVTIVGNNTPTAGSVTYGDGTNYASTAAGTAGQLLRSNGSSAPTWATVSAGLTLGTPVATTSGTSIDFTGIPSGVKQIVVSFNMVSTNGTSNKVIQIGDAGGIETTGYESMSTSIYDTTLARTSATASFTIASLNATDNVVGSVILTLEDASDFTWCATGVLGSVVNLGTFTVAGRKSLSAVLDRVRITTLNGTDAFDAGEVNIAYF
jgi:hypothetical protein